MRSINEIHEFLKNHDPEILIEKYKQLCKASKYNTYISLNENMTYDINLANKKLFCVPIAIKDLFCIKDMKTTCGSKMLENFIPNYTATIVQKLLNEGAIIVGKSNLDEFAMGSDNTTSYFGNVINPLSKEYPLIPGGSSGGSAAAVAEGSAVISIGSDTGGSIRYPAAMCNVVGLKPTYGRCSRYGMVAFSSSLDQAGPITNNVRDAARILDVMSGFDINDSTSSNINYELNLEQYCDKSIYGKKIGIITDMIPDDLSPESRDAFNSTIAFLKSAHCEVIEYSIPEIMEYSVQSYYVKTCVEASSNLSRYNGLRYGYFESGESFEKIYKNTRNAGFGEEVRRRIINGSHILSKENFSTLFSQSEYIISLLKQKLKTIFQTVDAIITPVAMRPAPRIGEILDPIEVYKQDIFTAFVNLTGMCAISLPIGQFSIQIVGDSFKEENIIQIAAELERRNKNEIIQFDIEDESDIVIGLEVHAQLNTKEKLFSRSKTEFTTVPNTNVSNFDIAIPGTLPILNRECLYKAIKIGLALNSKIDLESQFDRKHYFYPDLPSGYQITQYYKPILNGGCFELTSGKIVRINRAHIEQDAGKMIHETNKTILDFNRSGIPLIEIVTEPDLVPDTAVEFMKELCALLKNLDVCDGSLETGSFRADINISIRKNDGSYGTRVEIKNINSHGYAKKAIEYEVNRQRNILNKGELVIQETRLFDSVSGTTKSMRSKEDVMDYKYLPDPDIPIASITVNEFNSIRSSMPETTIVRYKRYLSMNLSSYNAKIIAFDNETAKYFEEVIFHQPELILLASKWIVTEWLGQKKNYIDKYIAPDLMQKLLSYIASGSLSQLNAKAVMKLLWNGADLDQAVKDKLQINDLQELKGFINMVEGLNDLLKRDDDKSLKIIIGKVMKYSQSRANPIIVQSLLKEMK